MSRTLSEPRTLQDLPRIIGELMPQLHEDLKALVRLMGYAACPEGVRQTREKVIDLFEKAEIAHIEEFVVEADDKKTTPLVYGEHPAVVPGDSGGGRAMASTVLLYAHYDVQPPGTGWTVTEPFVPKEVPEQDDTRLYGRGSADDKSGVLMHLAMLRAFKRGLPVNLKILIEGEEEIGTGILEKYLVEHPDDKRFHADYIVVADTGNVRRGMPTVTTSLRGFVALNVTVRTLEAPVHSGMYGGPAPDAFMALVRMLATLHDDKGDVAVELDKQDLGWEPVDEKQYRADAGVRPNVSLIGTESLQKRLYGKPSINVTGLDGVPALSQAINVLRPTATAKVSVRLAPNQDPETAYTKLVEHFRKVRPWGVDLEFSPPSGGSGFHADPSGPWLGLAQDALRSAYPKAPRVAQTGQGGSIPLVNSFKTVNPRAEILLWGCEEPRCAIHAPNESVSYAEFEAMTLAQALLLQMGAPGGPDNT
ncbi:M20/M25/M40 family metallo-hydrolase [Actinokineospora iranica]|uniref:Acetylornithine deacetylase/Succinyl-diaminopimelate desuccinylase n=1 Tax=Actinokineospora iranica TaxID=1271860 RepID=A0A1G6ZGN9_9PSEU|nr:M20/M25/M40 family metallo-hydrolase [Actinokineospora iranica]SDE01622.1 Acetylornithine deacetylase/Succinyl-diaminopimelate desuccinylase [Actinokineospora iranica]